MEKNARHGKECSIELEGPVAAGGSNDARVSLSQRRREPTVGGGSTMAKLMSRELGIGGLNGRRPPRPDVAFCAEKFRHFKLREEFNIHAEREESLDWMISAITKIIPANDFIFVIDWNGFCVAFNRAADGSIALYKKNGRIWYFNKSDVKMENLFYNKINDSIITVSTAMFRASYKMRVIPLESIRRNDNWESGTPVFGSRTNNLPIFDSCNNLAIISLYQDGQMVNNIYETKNYKLVHSFPGEIQSITTRPGIMIVAYRTLCNNLPIKVFSTKNWMVLEEFSYPTPPRETMQFIGLCYENLLLKANDQNMCIIDLWNHSNVTTIENTVHTKLSLSFDLIANDVLPKFKNDMVVTCNSRGVQVPLLEDDCNNKNYPILHVNVPGNKKFALLHSWKPIKNPGKGKYNRKDYYSGRINICSTFNGKSIVEINPCDNLDLIEAAQNENDNIRRNKAPSSAQEALKQVTALFCDEEQHIIYTGNTNGYIHVWST